MSILIPFPRLRAWCLAVLLAVCVLHVHAAPETPDVAQARELVDTYYGNRDQLTRAAVLLQKAYQRNAKDPHVFVQAARITILGGHLSFADFVPGTVEAYGALLDRALALDPEHAKAHILRAEAFNIAGRYEDEKRELDAARALGSPDPWLLIGYSRYHRATGEALQGYQYDIYVKEGGPGTTASERKAYVKALLDLSDIRLGDQSWADWHTELAAEALKQRHPADAWTPLSWAELFFERERFDDAISHARVALDTMKFGMGYQVLAASLCARAAQLVRAGYPATSPVVQELLAEAKSTGVPRERVLAFFVERRDPRSLIPRYHPYVEKLLR
jgi:tetratricopeptide (TPR) repeat protein